MSEKTNVLLIVLMFLTVVSCDNANDLLNQHIKDGPIVYAARVNELFIQSGYNRIKVNVYPAEDVNRSYCALKWNITSEVKDSLIMEYVEDNYDKESECYYALIDFSSTDIQGNLLIEAQNVDEFGNRSLIHNEGAFVYGSIFTSTLLNSSISFSSDLSEIIFEEKAGAIGNLLSYEKIDGGFTDEVFVSENRYSILDAKKGGIIRSRTKYLINETDIDSLLTPDYLETKIPD